MSLIDSWIIEERDFHKLPLIEKLACFLHAQRCHYNHTDECGWWYEEGWFVDHGRDKKWVENHRSDHNSWEFKAARIIRLKELTDKEKEELSTKLDKIYEYCKNLEKLIEEINIDY